MPVEISFWVCARFELIDLSVCSATIALVLVRMLDIWWFLQSCGAVCAGFEVRPLRGRFRAILTSADRAIPNPRHPLRMRVQPEAEVPKER
ncbi:hypothetical protein STA1M1_05680 [Sinisalibacter aestuarii]|uniref:Transmembrane protein n=1 Tax=Sinisalibacter aestuarii TaxID=2949426 RepID=A0ABQ5LNX0_9RHOB|nr:hypothetical protein STA1M1_05680 [Sinisalibacter aestuarii]